MSEPGVDVEIEQPHQHHATGHAWLDKVLPISALFVSFVSIAIAYHHGEVMQSLVTQNERLVQANSMPHVMLESRSWADASQHLDFSVKNGGVGPADIRSVEMLLDGKPVASSGELMKGCCGVVTREYNRSPIANVMLLPGETLKFLQLDARPAVGEGFYKIVDAWGSKRITARVCYCSVFSECWTTSNTGRMPPSRPVRVQECRVPPVPYDS